MQKGPSSANSGGSINNDNTSVGPSSDDESLDYSFAGAPSIDAQKFGAGFNVDYSNMIEEICNLCEDRVRIGEGATFPDCQHSMCLDCIAKAILQEQRHCPFVGAGGANCRSWIPTGLLRHVLPADEFNKYQRDRFVSLDDMDCVPNCSSFECGICFGHIEPGDGVVIRDCIHEFCVDCLQQTIKHCEDALVCCPYVDDDYACKEFLQQREVRGILGDQEAFDKYLAHCLTIAEARMPDTMHCMTKDCEGWCFLEDVTIDFTCPKCEAKNCLTCMVSVTCS